MKKIFYLWILPIMAWVFFLSVFISIAIFELVTPGYVSEAVGYSFVALISVLIILTLATTIWYNMSTASLKDTKIIVNLWMSKYFNTEKIEFNIESELNFDSKTVDTVIFFDGMQLKFYTQWVSASSRREPLLKSRRIKMYEKNLTEISAESKRSLMKEIELLVDKKTTLYLYKDDVEIKSQPMPRRFPFIYWNFNEFRNDMNKFLDRKSSHVTEEWHNPLVNKEQ